MKLGTARKDFVEARLLCKFNRQAANTTSLRAFYEYENN